MGKPDAFQPVTAAKRPCPDLPQGIRKRDGNQAVAVLKGPLGDHGGALRHGIVGQDRRVLLVVILIFLVMVIGVEPGAVGPE